MVSIFNAIRLIKLIKSVKHNKILIHQDHSFDLKKIIEKEVKDNILTTTSDLRFTQGKNKTFRTIPDLVIYIVDSYEPQESVKETINKYTSDSNIIIIGDKKSIRNIIKLFTVGNKFYSGNFLICFIPKQEPIEVNIEMQMFQTTINKIDLTFKTQKGLFSYKGIDSGTDFLLKSIDIKSNDTVLDFGCGCGVIGIYFAKKYPESEILMTDSNLRSIKFSKINAQLNNTKNISIKPAYLLTGIKGKFDKIISNPPTHTKLEEIEELIKKFKTVLNKNGEVYLVINKIVNYERFAEKYFGKVSIVAQNNQYKIIKLEN